MNAFYSIAPLLEMSSREIHELYKLRVDVFVHEQRTPYAEIDDADIHPDTHHLLTWDAKTTPRKLIGCARIVSENASVTRLGRIAVTPDHRGGKVAPEMIYQALRFASQTYPGTEIILDAQAPLIGYYARFGFEPVGELFDDSGVAHQRMRMDASRLAVEIANHSFD